MYLIQTPIHRHPIRLLLLSGLLLIFTSALSSIVIADDTEPSFNAGDLQTADFQIAVKALNVKSFNQKKQAVKELITLDHPRVKIVLAAMLESKLYYRKDDNLVVIAIKTEDGFFISEATTGDDLGLVEKRAIKKIRVNNSLRGQLRAAIAQLDLKSTDTSVRLNAVNQVVKKISVESANLFRQLITTEKDDDVLDALHTGIAMVDLNSDNKTAQLDAIEVLSNSLLPEAHSLLVNLVENSGAETKQADSDIHRAAKEAVHKIDRWLHFYGFIENVMFGLSLGSVLLLIAIGLAITFGVMGVINMAHGELMMLGAYTTYLVQAMLPNHIDISLFIAVPAAFLVSGLFGIAIERGVIRFLYGRPLETLLATFGISLILQQLVRTVISAQNVPVQNPSWMSGSLAFNPALAITYNRLYIFLFALAVFAGLLLILKKTSLGLQVRAVSQNRAMAKAMGVRTDWVDALTFGLGAGVAGVAGVALSQLTNVGPNLGQTYIVDSFMVVVFGGVGNLWGTFVGALSLGVVNKFIEPWAGAVLAKILVLVFIILFIQKRPRGLFPQKGRAAES